jgi:hypothetical protein
MEERRDGERREQTETAVNFKLWGIFVLFASCIGWLFLVAYASGERITRVETTQKHVVEVLVEIKNAMQAIKTDLNDDMKEIKVDLKEHVKQTDKAIVKKWQDFPATR